MGSLEAAQLIMGISPRIEALETSHCQIVTSNETFVHCCGLYREHEDSGCAEDA